MDSKTNDIPIGKFNEFYEQVSSKEDGITAFSDEAMTLFNSMVTALEAQDEKISFLVEKTKALDEYVDELKELNKDFSFISNEALKICDSSNEKYQQLTLLYSSVIEKSSSGGKSGRPYKLYENEIKLALDKYLDATKENKFTLNDVATEIANAIYRKNGEIREPSEPQIIRWKKTYTKNNRSSIY